MLAHLVAQVQRVAELLPEVAILTGERPTRSRVRLLRTTSRTRARTTRWAE